MITIELDALLNLRAGKYRQQAEVGTKISVSSRMSNLTNLDATIFLGFI